MEGRVVHLQDHVDRLFRSARMLRIQMPVTPGELFDLIVETAARNGMREVESAYLRPLVSRGQGPLGLKYSNRLGAATLVIIPQVGPRRISFRGEIEVLTAAMSSYIRPGPAALDPRIKTNNYLTYILAFLEASDRGADIAIVRDPQNFIAEGHAMNIFAVREGRVLTPMESSALGGITRRHVLDVAQSLGLTCVETNLTAYDLRCADELFITSSLEGVAALASIDGEALPAPVPGPVTTAIRGAYVEHAIATASEIPERVSV
ncbi:MAG: aminotransferase class IV family protein [Candidatus Dormibacteraeota bacterium]|uniref:Aminotransferase class IV family protein n=2 Tax=Candidatus Dormibacteria TaxID=3126996 RepID=A0A934K1V1_9BACT|nr:aminotransferase class IV family protein [Candidatus Dormibacteraeota bacterium]MBJ7603960.1 aminotransferase class IV family protein [Candidatus Dormibacteraeota bacterium]MBJ7607161.1 aminotransferase class IV family protein [Candidatus Dormibacteraeota bacterium]